jgi:hypothetical protein
MSPKAHDSELLDDAHRHAAGSLAVLRRLAEASVSADGDGQRLFWEGVADILDAVTDDLASIRECADRLVRRDGSELVTCDERTVN